MFCITAGLVQMDSYIGIARLVLLVTMHLVLCFFPCLQARDARHHGWYGPGVLVCWFLALSLALCSSCCLRPQMPVIMAGMDHRTVWRFKSAVLERGFSMPVVVLRVSWSRQCFTQFGRFRSCSSSRSSISCCGSEAYSHGLAVQQTIEFPQLLRYMWSQAVQFPRWFAVLGHADDMPVVVNNRCLELDSVVLQRFHSCSSFTMWPTSWLCISCRFHRCRSCV